jgi:hypothetical protein
MRNFDRLSLNSYAVVLSEHGNKRVVIQNFSRMGVGFLCEKTLVLKTFVSLLYQNENQQIIQMKSYVKHVKFDSAV